MPTDPKESLRASVRAAQERDEADIEAAREGRREALAKAPAQTKSAPALREQPGVWHRTRYSDKSEDR